MKKRVFVLSLLFVAFFVTSSSAQVGWWKFNNNVTDASGNGYNGTAVNSPTYSTSSKEGTHALLVNGTSQYVNLGNPALFPSGTSPRTMAAWVMTSSVTGARTIFAYGTNVTGQAMTIGLNGTALLGGAYNDNIQVNNFWTTDVWHHVCMTYDGTTAKLYGDGVLLNSTAKVWTLVKASGVIGRSVSGSNFWSGSIDDVRLYNTALTASEVLALASLPPTAPTGLAATAASSSSINLSWTDASTNETGFEIERSTTSGSGFALVTTAAANATSNTNTGLLGNTTYYYRIRTVNTYGSSSYSAEASATTAPPTQGTSWWPLDNNASDVSGNAVNGTLVASPTFDSSIKMQGTHALSFNGTSQYVDLGNPSSFPAGSSSVTLSAWAQTGSVSSAHTIMGFGNSTGTGTGIFIGSQGAGLVGGGFNDNLIVNGFWTANVWHHICLTYDGTTMRLYADGVQVASAAKSLGIIRQKAFIGRNVNSSAYWSGYIDDVKIFNSALTAAQVQSLASTTIPVVPTSLTATATSTSSIDLGWTDASNNESGFQIERSLTSGGTYTLIATAAANATSYTDAGLTANTPYYYRVRSTNANGNSAYTTAVSATTLPAIPTAPSGLSATAVSPTTINLSWTDASNNETGFQIERSLTSGSGYTLVTTTAANVASYSDVSLISGTTYYYRIRAINGAGNSAYTAEVSATTLFTIPIVPTGVTTVIASTTSITLNWTDASSNETGFQIERSLAASSGFVLIATTAANVTTYSSTGLTEGTTYYYRIRSTNPAGNSAYTTIVVATPASIPNPPSGLIVTAPTPTSVNVTWTDASTNETGFKIERSLIPSSDFAVIFTTTANVVSFLDNGRTPNTPYFYRIRAFNAAGSSVYTAEANVTTPVLVPVAPSSLSTLVASPTSVDISWNDNSNNETEFQIERSSTSGGDYSLIATTPSNTVVYTDVNLTSGDAYYYRVRANNGGGPSAYAAETSVRMPIENANGTCANIFCGPDGSVGIGTPNVPAGYRLAVNGKIMAEGVKVLLSEDWPDYVFEEGYNLTDIPELKKYISVNGHLPNVPSAQTIEKEGIDVAEINVVLLEKIEELSLYLIQMEERMKALEQENEKLKEKNKSKR